VYCPPGFVDAEDGTRRIVEGSWRADDTVPGLDDVGSVGSNRYARSADSIREMYAGYFNSKNEEIEWLYVIVSRIQ
jgi:hypothetical protein